MMRAALVILVSLLSARAPAAPVPTHLMPNTPPYYPTEVGAKWVYDWNGRELVETISEVEREGGAIIITLQQQQGEQVTAKSSILRLSKEGLARLSVRGSEYTEPYWLLKAPSRPGDKWNLTIAYKNNDNFKQTGTKVIGDAEEIDVMGKKMKAIHVITDLSGAQETMHSWYVPGIGLVKQTGTTKMTLKSFTSGAK